jgi:membrane protease YdiL (CAAX protease family)
VTQSPSESFSRNQILAVMGVTAVILLIVAKVWQRLGSVRLVPVQFTASGFGQGAALACAIVVLSSAIYRLWPDYRRNADAYLELVLTPLIWPDLIWLGLLPGLSEELLFRGVMLPALGFNWLALIFSSAVFGVLHLSNEQQWPYVIWAAAIGLALGFSAMATGNLLVPIFAHILTNWASSALWKLTRLNKQPSKG